MDRATLPIGKLGRPHGTKGEIVLRPFNSTRTPPPTSGAIAASARVLVDGREMLIRSARRVDGGWLVFIEGIDSREAAASLTHAEVLVPRGSLPPLGPGEFYVEDLTGCCVLTVDGRSLGVVRGTFWNGAHDVMSVEIEASTPVPHATKRPKYLIPVVPEHVRTVDLGARRVTVRWEEEDSDDGGL